MFSDNCCAQNKNNIINLTTNFMTFIILFKDIYNQDTAFCHVITVLDRQKKYKL